MGLVWKLRLLSELELELEFELELELEMVDQGVNALLRVDG